MRYDAVELLLAGQATLRETAQRFRALADGRSDDLLHFLSVYHPGRSVDELHYLHVLNYVDLRADRAVGRTLRGAFGRSLSNAGVRVGPISMGPRSSHDLRVGRRDVWVLQN